MNLRLALFAGLMFALAGIAVIVTFVPLLLNSYDSAASIALSVHDSVNTRLVYDVSSQVRSQVDLVHHLRRYYQRWPATDEQKFHLFDVYSQYNTRLEQFHAGRESDGAFVSMYRFKPPHRMIWKWAVRNATVPCRKTFALDANSTALTETFVKDNGCSYDPRLRSWYGQVNHSYLASTPLTPMSDDPGVKVYIGTQMLEAGTGRPIGVFHVDLSTDVLVEALRRTSIGRGGEGVAFIYKGAGEVFGISWAGESTTDLSQYNASALNPIVNVKNVTQLTHPLAQKLVARFGVAAMLSQSAFATSVTVKDGSTFMSLTNVPSWGVAGLELRLAVAIDERLYVAELIRARTTAIVAASVVVVLLCLVQAVAFYGIVARPVTRLTQQMDGLRAFKAADAVETSIVTEVSDLQEQFHAVSLAMVSFSRYVPKEVVSDLLGAGGAVAELGMAPRRITVMFIDIANFTSMCESFVRNTDALSDLLAAYFRTTTTILLAHGTTIDKFIGDAVMCFWGAPLEIDHAELRALLAGLRVKAAVAGELSDAFGAFGTTLAVRAGVSHGTALCGNVGSEDRMNYTALGDVVNTAARLEGVNKHYNSVFMAPTSMIEMTGASVAFVTRALGGVVVKGKTEAIEVSEIVAMRQVEGEDNVMMLGSASFMFNGEEDVEKNMQRVAESSMSVSQGRLVPLNGSLSENPTAGATITPSRREQKYMSSMDGSNSNSQFAGASASHGSHSPNNQSLGASKHQASAAARRKVAIEGVPDLVAATRAVCTLDGNVCLACDAASKAATQMMEGRTSHAQKNLEAALRFMDTAEVPASQRIATMTVAALRKDIERILKEIDAGDASGVYVATDK